MEVRLCDLVSVDLACSRVMGALVIEERQMKWCMCPDKPGGQCYDLGLLHLVGPKFGNHMHPKDEVGWLPEYTEWPGHSVFLPWWYGFIPRHQCHDSSGCDELWKSGSGTTRHLFHIWICHHRVHRVQTLAPLGIFGMCWRRLCRVVWPSTRQKMNAALDGNKCRKLTETMVNVYGNQG